MKGNSALFVNHLLQPENRLYINKLLKKGLDRLSVKRFHMEQVPLKWWQVVRDSFSSGLTIPDSLSDEITQVEHFPLI